MKNIINNYKSMRLTQRNINLSDDQSMRLQKGIAAADDETIFCKYCVYSKCADRCHCNGPGRNQFKCIYKY